MGRALILGCLLAVIGTGTSIGPWSDRVEVRRRDLLAVTYRARLEGEHLVVEARHEPGWHTYAMDNVERARALTGRQQPETEMPTQLDISGGLRRTSAWLQTPPEDLSQPELRWYTWGFSGTSHFAAAVEQVAAGPAVVRINGQACTESQCLWIDDLVLEVALEVPGSGDGDSGGIVDLGTLVKVEGEGVGSGVP